MLWAVLSRNADVLSKHKADVGCCNFNDHKIELEEAPSPQRKAHDTSLIGGAPSANRNTARIRYDRTLKVTLGLWGYHGLKERETSVSTFAT